MDQTFSIGQVARTTGVAATTIRYYEEIGVLPTPSRAASGFRRYDQPSVERLRFVRRARALGLPLQELKTLVSSVTGGLRPAFRPRLLGLVREQLAAVQRQIAELELLRHQLEEVSHRMLTSAPGRHAGTCRCLESGKGTERDI
ncbi:MAG: hypothetical protein DMD80_01125 [Candidatus Rokuibacteriota bacterium]|nr:MAG: hypothetical protein DMD80_01125 [Candidatus Rokubacteria bacterium]PYN18774.1 MAG: hypothetical protein DMD76_28665 [Candidatus Rokubacteria bacterium]